MKKHLLLLITLVFTSLLNVNAITLNGVEFVTDTLSCFSPGPGAMYYQLRMLRARDRGVRLDCWLMKVDTKNPYVTVEEVLSHDSIIGTERPSAMAIRKTTPTKVFYGGVNGDFFATTGDVGRPTGLTIVNNEFAYTPTSSNRRVAGVGEDMRGMIGTIMKYSGKLVLPDTTLTIKHVNYTRAENQLVLYNQYNGTTTKTNQYGTELLIELLPDYQWHTTATLKAKVVTKQVGVGSMAIPAGKAVLSGHGTMQAELNRLNEGDTVTLKLSLTIDGKKQNMSQCIGSDTYALIVDSGRVEQVNFWDELHPRTAFGHTENGDTLLFLVVDGRGVSAGCTTKVLGEIIHYYGAWRAANWDGGGSSCLYIRPFGEVNHGSDGVERAVGNGMFAVANIPAEDNTIASIAAYNPNYSLPRYGLARPRFLGYNRYGVLIDTDVQGVTLTCDPSVGEVLPDGRFFANGTTNGLLHATLNDSVGCDLNVRIIVSAPIAVRLDSVLLDSKHPYEVEVRGQVGNNIIEVLPAAMTWNSLDEQVVTVTEEGMMTGVGNGTTQVIAELGDYSDTMLVKVEIPERTPLVWEDFHGLLGNEWTVSATAGFDPTFAVLADEDAEVFCHFNYNIGRSPFLKLAQNRAMYSQPDTIRWAFSTDAQFQKINLAIRPNNAQLVKVVTLFPDGVPANTLNQVAIPVRETFGDDVAIFPLWLEYINFLVDTKTTTGAHSIMLKPMELVYNEYATGLKNEKVSVTFSKELRNGMLFLVRDGVTYTVLGQKVKL